MKFVLFIAVMYSGLNLSADLQDALNDYQKKNYKSAYEQFMQLANVTNADAFYNIGVMFYKGQHVEKDITQAYAWMKLANQVDDYFTIKVTEEELGPDELLKSNQIFSLLNSQYGPKYFESKFNPLFDQNEELVLDALSPKPLVKFAPIFPERAGVKGVPGHVIMSFRINPDGRVSDVQVISEYPSGFGFAKSARKITRKFKYEAWDVTKDQTKNFYPMINVIRFDTSMPLKQKEKFDRLVDEASNNSAKAQFALANFLSPVYGVVTVPPPEYFNKNYRYKIPENKLQGNKLLLNAAVNGNAQAQAYLGMRLIIGRDVEVDTMKGLNWLKQAVANGSEYAKTQLELLGKTLLIA